MELDAQISTLCNNPSYFMILVEALSFNLLRLGPISFKSTLRCEEFLNIMKHVNIDQWGFFLSPIRVFPLLGVHALGMLSHPPVHADVCPHPDPVSAGHATEAPGKSGCGLH